MKVKDTLLSLALAAGFIGMSLGVVGCGPKGVSDQTLATDIQARLYADPNARTANVKVNVANGAVTLSGDAPSADIALQVVNIANGTSGIKSVDNQLKVVAPPAVAAQAPPPPMAPPAVTQPTKPFAPANLAQNAPPPIRSAAPVYPPPPPMRREAPSAPVLPPEPVTATIPAGTNIGVTTIDSISSKNSASGQTFRASLSEPIVVDGKTVLPAGSGATILLSGAKGAGRIRGNSELEVRLVKIEHAGRSYDVETNVHDEIGKGRGKQTAVRSGIGAAAGAIIGAIAGGGKGAAIGTLAGGGAGAGFQLATHGQQVTIPSESRLTFSLQSPVVVTLRGRHEPRPTADSDADHQ